MDEIILEDENTQEGSGKFCPLLRQPCLRDRCAWWSRDWHEERNRYHVDCAVNLIAIGVNDESLQRTKTRKPI